jgi:hypothetical protein
MLAGQQDDVGDNLLLLVVSYADHDTLQRQLAHVYIMQRKDKKISQLHFTNTCCAPQMAFFELAGCTCAHTRLSDVDVQQACSALGAVMATSAVHAAFWGFHWLRQHHFCSLALLLLLLPGNSAETHPAG